MLKEVRLGFGGSFQWRGSVDPDAPFHAPKLPNPASSSLLHSYQWGDQRAVDEVVRIGNPVELRDGLVEPWKNATVTSVKADLGTGLMDMMAPPFNKARVLALGGFTQKSSGGGYSLTGFTLQLNDSTGSKTVLDGGAKGKITFSSHEDSVEGWQNEYLGKKPAQVKNAGSMDARRKKYLLETGGMKERFMGFEVTTYMSMMSMGFAMRAKAVDAPMYFSKGNSLFSPGLASEIVSPLGLVWTMDLRMFRYDLDTFVGRCDGVLVGKPFGSGMPDFA